MAWVLKGRAWTAAAALVGGLALAGSASAQIVTSGMFPAKPDDVVPRLIAQEDAPLSKLTPVTDEMLANPPASDWLMWRRTYNGWGFSPLDQVSKANVKDLQMVWSWALAPGGMENIPLVHDGVMFVQGPDESVVALNAANGDLLWRYAASTTKGGFPFKRMMALEGDKLFIAANGKHLIALDIHTGKVVWDQQVAGDGSYTSGPMALNGKIIIGASNCTTSRCSITAHESSTGKELWRFYTVAAPGEPGGDTWNGIPAESRYGGSVWNSGSYDPDTKLLYFGVGQPYPWNAFARGTSPLKPGQNNDTLYTNNTLALDPDTGKLAWHYSHLQNDSWDLDYVFERELIDLPVDGKTRKVSLTSGKMAIFEGLDAKTGKFLFADDLGVQTVVAKIDPKTGQKTINPAAIPELNKPTVFCPHPGGGRGPSPTAYDPQTGYLYVPMQDHCTEMTALPLKPGEKTETSKFTLMLKPGSDGNIGRLVAVDLSNRTTAWQHRERSPQSTGALPTAGGVVFVGDLDRYFSAYDAKSGEMLWRVRLNDTPNGPPITYSVDGRQYVAVTTGSGSPFTRTFGNLIPDVRDPPNSGATVWVFALPQR
jgi:alcohol dehydrogenase (cytochrome c)